MASYSGQPRVWSLWIYDRHCCLLFHADWSTMHNRPTVTTSSSAAAAAGSSSSAAGASNSATSSGGPSSSSAPLSLSEQSKLVYGVVFSLRNMTRKLSPSSASSSSSATPQDNHNVSKGPQQQEAFQSFSTSTYTLSHLQLSTKYTFIMITDPIAPPARRAPTNNGSNSGSLGAAVTSSIGGVIGGGGIPSTGGMSATGVLSQIARGPWLDFVVRNPACSALERMEEEGDDDDNDDEYNTESHIMRTNGTKGSMNGNREEEEDAEMAAERRAELKLQRKKARDKEQEKQRLTGIGKSIDSEAFRAAVERVLSQNKLSAPRM